MAAITVLPVPAAPVRIRTPSGMLQGARAGDVLVFKGVPFAMPPVGPRRWQPSVPVQPWRGVRRAQAYGPACAQVDTGTNSTIAATSREDCLTLNLWVPARARPGSRLPVMVFFHGGGNRSGSAAGNTRIDPPYDGSQLARHGVIVVTANYRLGLFGFLAHPELTAESPHHSSGNYALSDMLTALRWVRGQIGAFGGDPRRVTAFGQSAGAWNISALMTSPLSRGLIHRAILQSGNVLDSGIVDPSLADAERQGSALALALGAPRPGAIAALRAMPADRLLAAFARTPGREPLPMPDLNYDGYILPRYAALTVRDHGELPIPLLIGSTARDGDFANMGARRSAKAIAAAADPARPLASTGHGAPLGDAGREMLRALYGDTGLFAAATALYADGRRDTDGDIAVSTDINFRCGAMAFARLHARVAPSWRYEWTHGYAPLGAVHIWDVQYVFGVRSPPADQPRDRALADAVQRYWTNFARTGNPNGPGVPAWPRAGATRRWLDFASAGPAGRGDADAAECNLFDRRIKQIHAEQRSMAR